MTNIQKKTTTLCGIFKDEYPYVIEWVAYHRLIGFDRIVVYSNACSDGTDKLLDLLAGRGYVEHRPWPDKEATSPQLSAYNDAVQRCDTHWIMFLDADEFLYLSEDESVEMFQKRFSPDVSAIAINWRVFGSSDLLVREPKLVIERFEKASPREHHINLHCKTMAVAGDVESQHIHRCFLKRGRYVNEDGQDIEIQRWGLTPSVRHRLSQVNHYVVKSKEEFEGKRRRGNANRAPGSPDKFTTRDGNYFEALDLNQEIDNGLKNMADTVRDAISQITVEIGKEACSMTDRQLAVLWWRQLFSELGASEQTGAIGPLGQWARERTSALRTLNFALLMQLPIDCLIEVGAHNAETSKAFVAKKPKGRAVAYEAVPEIYERVVAAGLPEALTMHNVAVGAEAGVAKFRVPVEDRLKIWASSRKRVGNHEVREVLVPMITLDEAGSDVVQIRPGRDLALWIDVEGCALDVLRGGPNLLERRVGIVFVEVNDVSAYEGGATALDIISLFLKNGFIPVARDNQYGDAWNLLAVHEDCYFEARETIARWFYKNSGVTVATNWLAGKLAPANGV